jgi:hypothetical protein
MSDKLIEFEKQCKEVEASICAQYVDPNGLSEPIVDGIVNHYEYLNSKFKILWILKEPYDDLKDGVPCGGGWHFCNDFLAPDGFYKRIKQARSTWHPIIYTTYGLLNDFMQYESMDYIRDDESMAEIVRSIGVINVKKLPGYTRTYDYESICQAYINHKDILLKQVNTYNPDIIIGGSTLQLFYDDLGIRQGMKNCGSIDYAIKDSKLFIAAYHPAQTKIKRDIYVNDILNIAKKWSSS